MPQVTLNHRCDAVLIGRLGRELASVYRDALHAPVPSRLQVLIDQLRHIDAAPRPIAVDPAETT